MMYPYYLHNNQEYATYWKNYFESNPLYNNSRIEIYVDFPFCRSICKFCVFGSYTISKYKDVISEYEDAVLNLVSEMKDIFPERVNNIYFGGGSPTLWNHDSLKELISNIPIYSDIKLRTFEVHPFDINDELLEFLINDMKIKTVSIGIQSFDEISNRDQCRLYTDKDIIKDAIDKLHRAGVYVNIDIVALFNYDNSKGWEIFKQDLDIAASMKPDCICSSPNFKTQNYYGKSIYYRRILKEFLDTHPRYIFGNRDELLIDIKDVLDFEEEPYYLRTPEYQKFYKSCNVGIIDRNPEVVKNNIIIAFGGNGIHNAISRAGANMEEIASRYDFEKHRFIHQVNKIKISNNDSISNIRIGTQLIDKNFDVKYNGE